MRVTGAASGSAEHAGDITVQVVRFSIIVEVVAIFSAFYVLLLHIALDLDVTIISVIPVYPIAQMMIVIDLIAPIVMFQINVMYVIEEVVANVLRIWNAKTVTLVIALLASRRQALVEFIYVKIVVDSNAFIAVCVDLTLFITAALGALISLPSLGKVGSD